MDINDCFFNDEYYIIQEISSDTDSEVYEKMYEPINKKGIHLHSIQSKIKIIKYVNEYNQKETVVK